MLKVSNLDNKANLYIKEFVIFVTPPDGIAVALPAIVFATVYLATWLKFWFLDEGDMREYRFWSMIDLI